MDSFIDVLWILPQFVLMFFVFCFSLSVGSFLNVVIYRLPIMLSREWEKGARELLKMPEKKSQVFNLIYPRSRCRKCNQLITAIKNIPIISYLLIKGKCSNCQEKISIFYPLVELLTAVLGTWVFIHFGPSYQAIFALIFVYVLIVLSGIDSKTQLLPDVITLPFMWLGIVLSFFDIYLSLETAILGAIIAYMSFWCIRWLSILLFKKDGLGMGDAKLLAAIFTWVHIQYLPIALIIACLSGIAFTLITRLYKKQEMLGQTLPFGPYLCISGLLVFLYGNDFQQMINQAIF